MLVLSGTLQLVVILTATSITTGLPTDISETASGVTAGLPRDISETASGVTAGLPRDISETASSVTDGLPTDIRETVVNSRETDKTEKQIERFVPRSRDLVFQDEQQNVEEETNQERNVKTSTVNFGGKKTMTNTQFIFRSNPVNFGESNQKVKSSRPLIFRDNGDDRMTFSNSNDNSKSNTVNFGNTKKTVIGDAMTTFSDNGNNDNATNEGENKSLSDDSDDSDDSDVDLDDTHEDSSDDDDEYIELSAFQEDDFPEEIARDETQLIPLRLDTNPFTRQGNFIFMALGDINTIFGKKKAKQCKKEKKTYFQEDGKCYKHSTRGPCPESHMFVAIRKKLRGKCVETICKDDEKPFLHQGVCQGLYGPCRPGMRLYYNRFGESICDCDEGFLVSSKDGACYKEFSTGNCREGQTWRKGKQKGKNKITGVSHGKCLRTNCRKGEVMWSDGQCYRLNDPQLAAECFDQLVLDETSREIVCTTESLGRGIASVASRKCRRGRFWSQHRQKCVRGFG